MYNQLFKTKPTEEIVNLILNCFGLSNVEDSGEFTIQQLETIQTIDTYKFIEEEIKKYYIPCKAKLYFGKYEYKNIITICRQILKTVNYTIISKEKYCNKKKYLIYKLISLDEKKKKKNNNGTDVYVLNFN
tara:strand:- start:238 stop:630 length:393 start_codon:yes stop_codon:yes gene_type:complete